MSYSLDTIRLLVAHDSKDEAEQLINTLRNAGRATRAELVLNEDELISALKSGNWELLLCRPEFGGCSHTSALEHLQRLGKSLGTLILTDTFDSSTLQAMLEAGAQGAAPSSDIQLLLLLIDQQLERVQFKRDLQQSEIALRDAEKRLSVLMDQSRDAIAYVVDGMHIHANEVYLELFGYEDADDLAGMPIMDMVSSDDRDKLKKLLRTRAQDESKTHEIECKGRSQSGSEFDATFVFSPSTFDGEDCTQIVIRQDEGVDEATLRELTETDATTGLPNRSWFMSQLDQSLSQALDHGKGAAVFYLRIDGFDRLQTQLGIEAADFLLKQVADALKEQLGDAPLARISGEEFALLKPLTEPEEAQAAAESLRAFIEQLMPEAKARTVKITSSIGVAFIREDSRNSQKVLTKALECCNKARANSKEGGNAVLVHNPLDDLKAGSDEAIALTLKQALEKQNLRLQFQPVMSLSNAPGFYFEVFASLPQADDKPLSPDQFMAVAGEHGLAAKVDGLIAISVMKQLAALPDNQQVRLLINLSGHSLQDKNFSGWLLKAIRATKLDPKQITFQFNEGDANTFLKQMAQFAATMTQAGCQLSISRFGGTISPFKLLEQVPAQQVKFDRSFTNELANKEQRDKFALLTNQAHEENRQVVVGFVESAEQMQHLWTLGGVDYLQGYYLAPPEDTLQAALQQAAEDDG